MLSPLIRIIGKYFGKVRGVGRSNDSSDWDGAGIFLMVIVARL
jgi:hypothetical protein